MEVLGEEQCRLTSDAGSHLSLGKSAWTTLAWEACLILKARSYASRVDSRPRALEKGQNLDTKRNTVRENSSSNRPFERRRAPRPLRNPHHSGSELKREGLGRTQVVVFQSHPSIPGQIRVPKRDGLEPAGEGFGGADVGSEGRTEWAEDGHRLRLRVVRREWGVEGERVEEMGGMGFVARCFPACPMLPSRSRVGGRSGLFVPVWITYTH